MFIRQAPPSRPSCACSRAAARLPQPRARCQASQSGRIGAPRATAAGSGASSADAAASRALASSRLDPAGGEPALDEVLLVILLRAPEIGRGRDLRCDGPIEARLDTRL